jgi:hypothetical protein
MARRQRRNHGSAFKAKIPLPALKGDKSGGSRVMRFQYFLKLIDAALSARIWL